MTVADMNRLEQAARISMGEFEDSEATVPPPSVRHISMRILALGLAAAVILAVMLPAEFLTSTPRARWPLNTSLHCCWSSAARTQ
ncbi:hypothetical protein [Mesorhizobium sp. M0496]|uniref:hypothetical protein n=1 Tax=Mesorhizobium sp. M0496 TaxID=2956952 RepID=UPI00333893DE